MEMMAFFVGVILGGMIVTMLYEHFNKEKPK